MGDSLARPRALIDTGPIVALLDRSDRWHKTCAGALYAMGVPLLTSEAVLTEVFHLAARGRIGFEDVWECVHSEVLVVASIENDELLEIHRLMTRYADRPMDFADATLVYLAKRKSISTILTIDFSDFATYRIEGKRPFLILPSGRS